MREIKFRAWLTDRKEIIEFTNGGEVELEFNPHGLVGLYIGKYEQTFLLSEFILMQYTGLKDKNGKEIYEGDIVSCPRWNVDQPADPVIYDVAYEGAGFGPFHGVDPENWRQCEVIGNIYENGGLLK